MPKPNKRPRSARMIFGKVSQVLGKEYLIPQTSNYGGSGGPGRLLEDLLGIQDNNKDSPDIEDWELKFNGGKSLLTLFHKEPEPRGIINSLVSEYGWNDKFGRISFRLTISGCSDNGLYVKNEDDRIVIRHKAKDSIVPHWKRDTLMCTAGAKLRRLILVTGRTKKNPRRVEFLQAKGFWDFRMTDFLDAIETGMIKIDFDARTKEGIGTGIRNHGTKFRIRPEDLSKFYNSIESFS